MFQNNNKKSIHLKINVHLNKNSIKQLANMAWALIWLKRGVEGRSPARADGHSTNEFHYIERIRAFYRTRRPLDAERCSRGTCNQLAGERIK